MVVWILRTMLVFASFCGYVFLLSVIDKDIKKHFIPIVLQAVFSVWLTIAEYMHVGVYVVYFSYYLGLVLFLLFFLCNRKTVFANRDLLLLLAGIVILALYLYGKKFEHADSYSHWGLIVQRMRDYNHLPDISDITIQFHDYPVGMSILVYYYSFFIGENDWTYSLMQGFVIFSALFALLSYADKKMRNLIVLIVAIFSYSVCHYNTKMSDMLVDVPVSLVSGAIFLLIYANRRNIEQVYIYLILLIVFLITIKNSGWVFACILSGITIKYLKRNKSTRAMLILVVPIAYRWIWTIHVRMAYPGIDLGNHALSLKQYHETLMSRDLNGIIQVVGDVIMYASSDKSFNRLILFIFLASLSMKFFENRCVIKQVKFIGVMISSYWLFSLGIAAMYIVSLVDGNMNDMLCYDRYISTVNVFNYYLAMILFFEILVEGNKYLDYKSLIKGVVEEMGVLISEFVDNMKIILPDAQPNTSVVDKLFCSIPMHLTWSIFDTFLTWVGKSFRQTFVYTKHFAPLIMIMISLSPLASTYYIGHYENDVEYRTYIDSLLDDDIIERKARYLVYDYERYNPYSDTMYTVKEMRATILQYALDTDSLLFCDSSNFYDVKNKDWDYIILYKQDSFADTINKLYGCPKGNRVISLNQAFED